MVEDSSECDMSSEPSVISQRELDKLTLDTGPEGPNNCETGPRTDAADSERKTIDVLPDEVIVDIFSYFSFNELIDVLQNVCSRWKRLVHDPLLWRDKVYIIRGRAQNGRSCCGVVCSECVHCRCEKTDKDVLRSACLMPQLRTLIMMRGIKTTILRKICRNCPNVTTLQIHGCQKMNYSLLKYIFESCPKVHTLIIGNDLLADQQYAEMVASLKDLKSLEVFDNRRNVGPVQLRFLADACLQLQEINLRWDYYPLEDLEYFINVKKHNLTSVSIRWTMAGKRCVLPLLKVCAGTLTKLQLNIFDVVPEEEVEAFTALGQLHNLRELHANQMCPSQPHLISLAFKPGCLTQLQRLHLPYATFLQDDTVVTISQGCPALRELRLKYSPEITEKSLSKIQCLKHLEVLELSGCNWLGGGAVAFIAQLPSLRTLILRNLANLKELQPSLQHILDMKKLCCLDILESYDIEAVPFDEFPGRLVNLRELHVTYSEEEELVYKKVFNELQCQMPRLRIFNTFQWTEDDWLTDYETDDDDEGY